MSRVHMAVLGMLNEKPMYGYEFKRYIAERNLNQWANVYLPAVYKALQSLEAKGYIQGRREVEGNNPPRIVYEMTEAGRNYLKKLVRTNLEKPKHKHDFWVAVAFMLESIDPETALHAVRKQLDRTKKLHDIFEDEEKAPPIEDLPFNVRVLVGLGRSIHEVHKKWLNELIDGIQNPENQSFFINEV